MAKRHRVFISFFLFLRLVLPGYASEGIPLVLIDSAAYIPLDAFLSSFELEHSFDLVTQKGKLYRKNHSAAYGVGLSAIIVDGTLYKSSAVVRRSRGKILIPLDMGQYIMEKFDPGIKLGRSGNDVLPEKINGAEQAAEERQADHKPSKERIRFIVIDPGHGGKDPGAVGKGRLEEKRITLKVSQYLAKKMRNRLGDVRIILTRKDDSFIELSRRTEVANKMLKKNENGAFLSIHVNSSLSGKISGYETYFLSQNPTNEEARNTAAIENNVIVLEEKSSSSKKPYDDVDYIEATMITTQIQKESSELAYSIQKGLSKNINVFSSRGVKKADFFVLRGVLMPAVLIEIGFITNKKEAGYLKRDGHAEAIAEGIADGVEKFIKEYNRLLKIK